jgi:hypothetical protein
VESDEVRSGRHDDDAGGLSESDVDADPFVQFRRWL